MSSPVTTRQPVNPDHPFTQYMEALKAKSIDMDDYRRRRQYVADTIGVALGTLYHLTNPKKHSTLDPVKAFRLELLSEGKVPAESVSAAAGEVLAMARRVLELRAAR